MSTRDDDFGPDGTPWDFSSNSPLDDLLKFVAPGSRLVYEYETMSQIGLGLERVMGIAPVIGIVRYTDRHELIRSVRFSCDADHCLLDYEEFTALLNFLDRWLNGVCSDHDVDRPKVSRVTYETRSGFVVQNGRRFPGAFATIRLASSVALLLSGASFEQLFRECQRVKSFLDEFAN